MIFDPQMAHKVVVGKKTQVRAPVRRDREFGFEKACSYRAGERYPVQRMVVHSSQDDEVELEWELGRHWVEAPYGSDGADRWVRLLEEHAAGVRVHFRRSYITEGHVLVTAVRRERLTVNIPPADVLAMGFRSADELFRAWRSRYNTGPLAEPSVWVVEFEPTEAPDLYLQARVGHPYGDYTTSPSQAIRDADAVVDPFAQERITEIAAQNRQAHLREEAERRRETMTLAEQLGDAYDAARTRGADVSNEMKIIEKQIAKIERKAGRAA